MTPERAPECRCVEQGHPPTEFGVMHAFDCPWIAWFRSTGGCMGDPHHRGDVMTSEQSQSLADRTLAAIDLEAGLLDAPGTVLGRICAADRERVASDLAGLTDHQGDGYTCVHEDAAHCPDAARYADGLIRTAALYGITEATS